MTRWVTTIVVACVAVFIAQTQFPALTNELVWLPARGLTHPWTAVTYMFLHGGFGHIFFNMLALYIFGPRLEARIGGKKFLGLYFVSGLVGALACFYQPQVAVLGASGAVFGVSLAYARYWPRDQVLIYGILPMTTRMMVILYAAFSVGGVFFNLEQGVAHLGHLGGFAGGWLYCLWMERFTGSRSFRALAEGRRPTPVVPLSAAPLQDEKAAIERWARIPIEQLHPVNREEFERIRTKLTTTGARSLTQAEREFLDRFAGLAG